MTIVCGDSHTSTHGAFGALAFGIGTSEVGARAGHPVPAGHAAEDLRRDHGRPPVRPAVTAKDLILALIARIGTAGATGHVIEYRGSAVRALSMEERMTVCNMSIEAGARAGMVAPDDTTFEYLAGPAARAAGRGVGRRAVRRWRALPTDEGAAFDREIALDAAALEPMITYGTNPGSGHAGRTAGARPGRRPGPGRAPSRYMGLEPGEAAAGPAASTWCSSGAAPTPASATCGRPRACCAAATWRRACACWWCPARSR